MTTGAGKLAWRALLGVVASAAATLTADTDLGTYDKGTELFRLQDPQIAESSGVVASSTRDGLFFTHNDSGDAARFFAVDDRGCTLARYTLAGVDQARFKTDHDMEDIARGSHDGQQVLWLADIGDNANRRSDIAVWRVVEPRVPPSAAATAATSCPTPAEASVAATEYRLTYPAGPRDAETLLVDPANGQLHVVMKTVFGESSVYAAPLDLLPASSGQSNALTLAGAVVLPPSVADSRNIAGEVEKLLGSSPDQRDTPPGFDLVAGLVVTGGDIAPDRSAIVVRTYTDAWVWPLGDRRIPDAFKAVPTKVPLVHARQGEAIAFTRDSSALVTTCEDVDCPAHIYRRPP